MPTPTSTRDRRRERTRRQILDAAWELAERDGIASLSLRDLAAAVDMRAPSLYTYFDGKAAIYDAMFAEGYRQLDVALDDLQLEEEGDATRSLTIATRAFLAFCQDSLPRYQLMFARVIPDWEPSADAYAVSVESYERFARQMAAAGVTDQRHLDLWTAVSGGLAAQQLANDPTGDRWSRLVDDAVAMFLAHVTPHH